MGKKIILEEIEEGKRESKSFTASHIMLYIILGVYIIVALTGIVFVGICVVNKNYESGAQGLITVGSIIGACSCTVVGFYSTKAAKENEIKLSNEKYRMRLELAKEIFKEYGTSLDDKSIDILQRLMSDKDVNEIPPISEQAHSVWQGNVRQSDFNLIDPTDIIRSDDEEGLG